MKANRFEIKRYSAEIKSKDKKDIEAGCCIDRDTDPESIVVFDTLEQAKEELKKDKYKPSCVYRAWTVPFYAVEEYAIECYEADEDGDFLDGSDYDWIVDYKFDEESNDIVAL